MRHTPESELILAAIHPCWAVTLLDLAQLGLLSGFLVTFSA